MITLEMIGIVFVVAFIISILGFVIFVNYKLRKLIEAMNRISGEVRRR